VVKVSHASAKRMTVGMFEAMVVSPYLV